MFNTAILELVIGLIFIFSLMAILVTQLNTLVTNARNMRAINLKESLIDLVGDKQLQAEILVHPLIKLVDPADLALMSLSLNDEMADLVLNARLTRVADISPNTFVEALVSILTVRAYGPLERAARAMEDSDAKRRILTLLSDLQATPSDERLAALRQAINGVTAGSTEPSPLAAAFGELQSAFTEVRTRNPELMPLLIGIARIRTPPFREALQVILYSVMTFPEALLKLQTWFSDGMQRSSSMFKEKLQKLSLIVACVMVMLMNVDTLSITQVLWEDPEFRASLAAAASAGVRSADITGEPGESPLSSSLIDNALDAQATAQKLVALNVPMGWSYVPLTPQMAQDAAALGLPDPYADQSNLWNLWPGNGNPGWFTLLLAKLVGLAVSAIAAAQGAPFWFDLLQKFTSRRSSG